MNISFSNFEWEYINVLNTLFKINLLLVKSFNYFKFKMPFKEKSL